MKRCALLLALCAVLSLPASAQTFETSSITPQSLNWEHTLTTRTAKSRHAVAKLKIYNNWTNDRHRLLIKYNVLGLGAQSSPLSRQLRPSFSMPDFNPGRLFGKGATYHNGTLGIVHRLDDDKLIAYSSEAGAYFLQPRHALFKRLRFDPWKKSAPELSQQDPPTFTPEQRQRLGHEVRALAQPILKNVFKSYYRILPEVRTFNLGGEAIEAHGHRLTMLINAGDKGEGAKWFRINAEWWLAPSTPGDGVLHRYAARSIADYNELHGFTSSMWLNELLPVLWQTMPETLHQAVGKFVPKGFGEGSSTLASGGAPLYAAMTMLPPQGDEKFSETGSVRVELQMTARDTRAFDTKVFDAPPEYKEQSLEPVLQAWDMGMAMIQSAFDDEFRLSDAGSSVKTGAKPKYSFSALHDYLSVTRLTLR